MRRPRTADIFDWAESHGHRTGRNPAGRAIAAALPAPARGVEHHRALPYAEVADAIAKVHASGAWTGTKRCFEWMVLIAARSGEARGAPVVRGRPRPAVPFSCMQRLQAGNKRPLPAAPLPPGVVSLRLVIGFTVMRRRSGA